MIKIVGLRGFQNFTFSALDKHCTVSRPERVYLMEIVEKLSIFEFTKDKEIVPKGEDWWLQQMSRSKWKKMF